MTSGFPTPVVVQRTVQDEDGQTFLAALVKEQFCAPPFDLADAAADQAAVGEARGEWGEGDYSHEAPRDIHGIAGSDLRRRRLSP